MKNVIFAIIVLLASTQHIKEEFFKLEYIKYPEEIVIEKGEIKETEVEVGIRYTGEDILLPTIKIRKTDYFTSVYWPGWFRISIIGDKFYFDKEGRILPNLSVYKWEIGSTSRWGTSGGIICDSITPPSGKSDIITKGTAKEGGKGDPPSQYPHREDEDWDWSYVFKKDEVISIPINIFLPIHKIGKIRKYMKSIIELKDAVKKRNLKEIVVNIDKCIIEWGKEKEDETEKPIDRIEVKINKTVVIKVKYK